MISKGLAAGVEILDGKPGHVIARLRPKLAEVPSLGCVQDFDFDDHSHARPATVNNPVETPTNLPAMTSLRKWIFIATSPISAEITHTDRRPRNLGNKIYSTEYNSSKHGGMAGGK